MSTPLFRTAAAAFAALLVCAACAQQSKYGGGEVTIGRFAITGILPEQDTVSAADSVRITLSLAFDCTNRIKRFEAAADTSGGRREMVLSVFGTFVHGRRPMCPVRIVRKTFAVKFPAAGEWEIAATTPSGKPLRTPRSAIVVR